VPKKHAIKAGSVVEIGYPFVMDQRDGRDADGAPLFDPSWRPGTKMVQVYDDHDTFADAIGTMVLTVVATFTPPGFPDRVFYTRRWRDPDGDEFGPVKQKLRCTSRAHFTALCKGYRHRFILDGEEYSIRDHLKLVATRDAALAHG
jgi:hypothetical protein